VKTKTKLTDRQIADLQRLADKNKKPSGGLTAAIVAGLFSLAVLLVTAVILPLLTWAVRTAFRLLSKLVVLSGAALREMATGEHRGSFLPVWPLSIALLPLPLSVPGWLALGSAFVGIWTALWAVNHEWSLAEKLPGQVGARLYRLGVAVRAGGRSLRWSWNRAVGRRVFSDRELMLAAFLCLGIAAAETLRIFTPAWVWMTALPLFTMYPVALWVEGRRVRPTAPLTSFQEVWNRRVGVQEVRDENKVVVTEACLPDLSGRWLSWDESKHQGVWELDNALAHEVRGKAGEIELALSHELPEIRRGSLELKHNKRDHVRHLVVRYTSDPIGDAGKKTYFEAPTLDKQGRYLAGVTPAGLAIHGRLMRPGGAAFSIVVGSTGSGKGVILRTMMVNAFSSSNVFCVGADGKGGTGIPWARHGADLYAWTPEQWALAIELTYDVLTARKARYGAVGKDQWSPFTPLIKGGPVDPLFFLAIDEIQEVVMAWPLRSKRGLAQKMQTISAQGRSVGVSGALSTQFGLVTDFWNNVIRTNFMGGGTTFIGKVGGRQAKQLAVQDVQDVDPSALPDLNGWFMPISRIDDVPRDAFRGVFLPTTADREDWHATGGQQGDPAPFGTAEEIIPKVVKWATLHPDDQAIVDRYRVRWEEAGSGLVAPAEPQVMLHSVPTGDDGTDDGESRVLRALASESLNTSQLARTIGMDRAYLASELLKRLESEGVIARDDDKKWSKVA
jgi:hypothetical protein